MKIVNEPERLSIESIGKWIEQAWNNVVVLPAKSVYDFVQREPQWQWGFALIASSIPYICLLVYAGGYVTFQLATCYFAVIEKDAQIQNANQEPSFFTLSNQSEQLKFCNESIYGKESSGSYQEAEINQWFNETYTNLLTPIQVDEPSQRWFTETTLSTFYQSCVGVSNWIVTVDDLCQIQSFKKLYEPS